MNNPNALNWQDFRSELVINSNLNLQFEYADGKWVNPSYHITEIKQAPITSVDCGGKINRWTEIIVQLWEPQEEQQEKAMKASKALSIVELVEKAIKLDLSAEVKVEFGNSKFDTRQMFVSSVVIQGENIIVNLKTDTVQCKALNRNQMCGSIDSEEVCCSPTTEEKPKIELLPLSTETCCTPGSGCC